jgi:hypothetical protein
LLDEFLDFTGQGEIERSVTVLGRVLDHDRKRVTLRLYGNDPVAGRVSAEIL